jgi:MscS family membrane protein
MSALTALGPAPWFLKGLPLPLRQMGPHDLHWWQWIALPVVAITAWFAGFVASRITRSIWLKIAKRTPAQWDDELAERMGAPLTLAWTSYALDFILPSLELHNRADAFAERVSRSLLLLAIFWAVWNAIEVSRAVISRSVWAATTPTSRSLLILTARISKVVVGAFALVVVLSEFGYPVTSLIAGLGVGGIALALAAQKTVENLFGAFSLGVDQPFREGDFVSVDNVMGTVEAMGLRSTRLRTLDRTIISIPNGKLAEMRIETFAARDRIRLSLIVGLVYGTTSEQLNAVLEGFDKALRAQQKIFADDVRVRFIAFGQSSLDIEINSSFTTTDFNEFTDIRQKLLLEFMRIIETAGTHFAFPTRTVHLENGKIQDKPEQSAPRL